MIEGVDVDDLKNGPGHYPDTPLPGQEGNAAIAGHRTTYGAPFATSTSSNPGDPITVTTLQGSFHYSVTRTGDRLAGRRRRSSTTRATTELTLTACHPKYSASKRIVIHAKLEGAPSRRRRRRTARQAAARRSS